MRPEWHLPGGLHIGLHRPVEADTVSYRAVVTAGRQIARFWPRRTAQAKFMISRGTESNSYPGGYAFLNQSGVEYDSPHGGLDRPNQTLMGGGEFFAG